MKRENPSSEIQGTLEIMGREEIFKAYCVNFRVKFSRETKFSSLSLNIDNSLFVKVAHLEKEISQTLLKKSVVLLEANIEAFQRNKLTEGLG